MNPICKFSDVLERNMDLLFLEEFVSSPEFLEIFISKINITKAQVLEIEHSKVHSEFGESDMTVIIETNGKRHGLLIEDKIDAIAMPEQYDRYVIRGNIGIENGDYESFDVFIVAPKKYLNENNEAQKYPNKVTYEECDTLEDHGVHFRSYRSNGQRLLDISFSEVKSDVSDSNDGNISGGEISVICDPCVPVGKCEPHSAAVSALHAGSEETLTEGTAAHDAPQNGECATS